MHINIQHNNSLNIIIYLLIKKKLKCTQTLLHQKTVHQPLKQHSKKHSPHPKRIKFLYSRISQAIVQLKQAMPKITSFKPHLNTYQCQLVMIINQVVNIPIKIVFLRNYPQQKPLIFVTQWIKHPLVNVKSMQVQYQNEFPWNPKQKLTQLLKRIQSKFTQIPPSYDSQLEHALQILDNYLRQVQSLRTKPQGTQPPQLPTISLESTLNTFEYQQNLSTECKNKNQLYVITANEYNQNLSRIKCVSQKFNKGKILREMQKQIQAEINNKQHGSINDVLDNYYKKRKQLHKMKILKQLYLQS